jgi:hypothetical protein
VGSLEAISGGFVEKRGFNKNNKKKILKMIILIK